MTEASNIEKIREKFLKAYTEYGDAIFRFCLFHTRNRDIALDVTQETFTRTWQYLSEGKKIGQIRAFLYKVARNAIIDHSRKKKESSLDALLESGFDIDGGIDEKEKRFALLDGKQIIEKLPLLEEKYQEALLLRFVEDLSIPEIAKIVGETKNNVAVRVHRALKMLEDILENENN